MGKKIEIKLAVLTGLFLVTCIFVYRDIEPVKNIKKPPLNRLINDVADYKALRNNKMADNAVKMLELDDYIFVDYLGQYGYGKVNLYIGYYYTAGKAYAAHSPLVCYPSQGWKIENKVQKHYLNVGSERIQYEEITTSFGDKRELVLYWYQADQFTTTNAYMNKIFIGYNKITKNTAQHAFVRVSTPINTTYEKAKKTAIEFIIAFYPNFVEFIAEQ